MLDRMASERKSPGPSKLRVERILEVHESTRKGWGKNALQWADRFEMSRRQFLRDIKFMQTRLGLPLVYDRHRNAYVYEEDPGDLPALPTTESDLFAIAVAHKAVAQYEGTPFAIPLRNAFHKLLMNLDSQDEMTIEGWDGMLSIQPFATDLLNEDDFEILIRAIRQKLVVGVEYQGRKDTSYRSRKLQPYHLFYKLGAWYLLAFDHPRGDTLKTFALHRLRDVTVVSGVTFSRRQIDLEKHIQAPFGVKGDAKPTKVVIEFKEAVGRLVAERKWHPSQKIDALADGRSRLTMTVSDLGFVAAWVLGWGAEAKVLQPAKLRRLVVRSAKATASLYAE